MFRTRMIGATGTTLVVLLTAPVFTGAQQAQATLSNIEPIGLVRVDEDRDGVPDRLGERVTIAGWANVESGLFHQHFFRIFLQDDTGAIALYSESMDKAVERGQRLIVSGRVGQHLGMTQLLDLELRVLPTHPRDLAPDEISLSEADFESMEGRLVVIQGRIVSRAQISSGFVLQVSVDAHPDQQVEIYLPERIVQNLNMNKYQIDDRTKVVGVIAQRAYQAPPDGNYVLWPRDEKDIRAAGISRAFYQRTWGMVLLILVFSVLWVLALRYQVKHKTRLLSETEEGFRKIYEGAVDAICLQDVSGSILSANPAAERLFGAGSGQLAGLKFADMLEEKARPQWESILESASTSDPVSLEVKIKRLDRQRVDVDLTASLLDLQDHSILLIFARDVTERKRVQEALNEEKERLIVTLASIGDGVITVNTSHEIIMMNRAAERLTGWRESRALGLPLDEVLLLVEGASERRIHDPASLVFTKGTMVELPSDTVLIDRNGVKRNIIASLSPLRDHHHHISGVVLAFRDITDQLKRGDEMSNAVKLESIGVLAGGIAHDFNNILTSVIGNLSLARSDGVKGKELNTALEEAEKASRRARDLTQQLLTFSKGGAPIRQTADISRLIRESAGFSLSGSNVSCNFLFSEDLWPVEVDEGQIIQVVNNLVINALDAMPEGGRLEIAAENSKLDQQATVRDVPLPEGRYVRVMVSDCGRGIPEEDLTKIFDPYFTTKPTGSGLGLAATYSIIRNHDGYIKVDSRLDVGTTFTFYLPASDQKVVRRKIHRRNLIQGKGRVLVMDDEPAVRRVACSMLKRLGYESDEAADGEAALAKYQAARDAGASYAAVIMDLTIPGGMGGREAITRLLEIDPDVTAIVSSGYSNDLIMADYQQYGFSGVVMKPYDLHTLGETLSGMLSTV